MSLCSVVFSSLPFSPTLPLSLSFFHTGSAFRDPAQGGRPEDGLAVSPGEPARYAELPSASRSRARPHLPGGAREEPDGRLRHGPCPPHQHPTLPARAGTAPPSFLLCTGPRSYSITNHTALGQEERRVLDSCATVAAMYTHTTTTIVHSHYCTLTPPPPPHLYSYISTLQYYFFSAPFRCR